MEELVQYQFKAARAVEIVTPLQQNRGAHHERRACGTLAKAGLGGGCCTEQMAKSKHTEGVTYRKSSPIRFNERLLKTVLGYPTVDGEQRCLLMSCARISGRFSPVGRCELNFHLQPQTSLIMLYFHDYALLDLLADQENCCRFHK